MLHRASSSKITLDASHIGQLVNDSEPALKRKRESGSGSADDRIEDILSPKSTQLLNPLPKAYFPTHSRDPDSTFTVIEEELLLDGNAKQNLATFWQTWENDFTKKIMELGMDKNLIDKDEYPMTAELEKRCVNMIADLWNAPTDNTEAVGCSTIGSSEAAMLGGMAAKWRWRNKRKEAGLSTDRPNMVCGSVQICWKKFAVYWDIEMREIEMSDGKYCITPEDVIEKVDENTIMVVPVSMYNNMMITMNSF